MIIDILFSIFLLLGLYRGFSKGFIRSIFSLLAIIVGVLCSLRFSFIASHYLQQNWQMPPQLVAIIAFILVFFITLLMVRFVAYLIEQIFKAAAINFFNKILGAVTWGLGITILFSLGLWFANQSGLLHNSIQYESFTYAYVAPMAPGFLDFFGWITPIIKEAVLDIESLF